MGRGERGREREREREDKEGEQERGERKSDQQMAKTVQTLETEVQLDLHH